MNKSKVMKTIFILMLALVCIVFTCNYTLAAEEDDFQDLLNPNSNTGTNNTNTTNTNTNTNKNNTNTNNSNSNTNAPTLNTNPITNTNNVNNSVNNLPKTGLSDAMPTMLLLVVFGVSAVYAYKKVKEYQEL